jgi:hypothetical protein
MAIDNIINQANANLTDAKKFINGFNTAIITPVLAKGVSGFEFDIPTGQNLTLQSDITDHYAENNTFINDHIVNKPVRYVTAGYVGEVVYRRPQGLTGVIRELGTKLSQVSGYLGSYTPGFVQSLQSVVTQTDIVLGEIDSAIQKAQNVVGFLASPFTSGLSKQMQAYKKIQTLWRNKTIVTVLTPWEYFDSMVIESITISQDQDSNDISEFSITLKEFRTSTLKFTTFNQALFPQANEVQASEQVDQGPIKGKEEFSSTLFKNKNALGQLLGGQ